MSYENEFVHRCFKSIQFFFVRFFVAKGNGIILSDI